MRIIFFILSFVGLLFGQYFDIRIDVYNIENTIGLSTLIVYDSASVEVVDKDQNVLGTQVEGENFNFLSNSVLLMNVEKINDVEIPGRLVIGYSSVPPVPRSGIGSCFSVRLKKLNSSSDNVGFDLSRCFIQDASGNIDGVSWMVSNNREFLSPTVVLFKGEISGIVDENYRFNYCLEQNYPNPFNGKTSIPFSIQEYANVTFVISNIRGQKVYEQNKEYVSGKYNLYFENDKLSSGIYFCWMSVFVNNEMKYTKSIKMIMIK